jgi:c-di-GMP-binding flagellar brake protein YcgR
VPFLEQRRWPRLELKVPLFLTGKNLHGRQFTELATALNVSAGGALIVLQNRLAVPGNVRLEVPHPPLPDHSDFEFITSGKIDAKIVRAEQRERYQLVALQFAQPVQEQTSVAFTGHPPD